MDNSLALQLLDTDDDLDADPTYKPLTSDESSSHEEESEDEENISSTKKIISKYSQVKQ